MNPIIPFFIRSACNAFPPSEGTSVNKMNLLHTTISFSFTPSMPFPSLPLYPPPLPPPLSCTPRPLCASRAGDDKHLSPLSILSLAFLPPPSLPSLSRSLPHRRLRRNQFVQTRVLSDHQWHLLLPHQHVIHTLHLLLQL